MVPMKATSAIRTKRSTPGKAMPVAAIRHAPVISNGRRSWRGVIQPVISVSSAVPNSDAVATMPTATAS